MHRLAVVVGMTAALLCAGVVTWRAEAMALAGAAQLSTAAKAGSAIAPAACRGGGPHCPPGYIWNGHACVPC